MINTLRMMFRTVSRFDIEMVTYFLRFIGEALIKRIYTALRNSPQWNSTLFIVTFDEHGGFYDHVTPPMNVPNPDGLNADDPVYFGFDRLGVRVPTLMISPWINKVRLSELKLCSLYCRMDFL
jgi:phospholipase C